MQSKLIPVPKVTNYIKQHEMIIAELMFLFKRGLSWLINTFSLISKCNQKSDYYGKVKNSHLQNACPSGLHWILMVKYISFL